MAQPEEFPLEEKAREVSSFLGEPVWLLEKRLEAVRLLEKRKGRAFISEFDVSKGGMELEVKGDGSTIVLPVSDAIARGNALKEQLGKPMSGFEPDDYLISLALFTEGNVVAVPAGKQMKTILHMGGKPPYYFATFFLFEDNCEAAIYVKSSFQTGASEARALYLGNGASVHFCSLQHDSQFVESAVGMNAVLGEASSLKFLNSNIGSREKRDGFLFLQNARGSSCEHYEASLARGSQKFWKDSEHLHTAPETYSRSVFKYATTDESRVEVDGRVTIEQSAPKSDTHLLANSLLLSEKSVLKVVPQLYVRNSEVMAGHGSALTPLPEEELFYLRSRGIGESESKLLVLQGFLQDVLSRSGIEPAVLSELALELEADALSVFPRD